MRTPRVLVHVEQHVDVVRLRHRHGGRDAVEVRGVDVAGLRLEE